MHNLETDEREAQNIKQVDVSARKHAKTGNSIFVGFLPSKDYSWTSCLRILQKTGAKGCGQGGNQRWFLIFGPDDV